MKIQITSVINNDIEMVLMSIVKSTIGLLGLNNHLNFLITVSLKDLYKSRRT